MNGLRALSGMESTILLESLLAGSLVILFAHFAAHWLRRRAAAMRHLVWALALGSLAVWPMLEVALPVWEAGPQWTSSLVSWMSPAGAIPAPAPVAESAPLAAAAPLASTPPLPSAAPLAPVAPIAADPPLASTPPRAPDVPVAPTTPAASSTGVARVGTRGGTVDGSREGPPAWWTLLPLVWLFGVGLVLCFLAFSVFARRWMFVRDATSLDDHGWQEAMNVARSRVGVRRSIRLLSGPRARVPATWGVVRPVVFMPAAAESWPEWQRRTALVHELAHIRRWDHLTQMLAWVAVALHWFNPLVWHARARLRAEAEHACDDLALTSGERPSQYATGLLSVAALLAGRSLVHPTMVAMARRPELGHRLEAILDAKRSRAAASRVWVAGAVLTTAFLTIPLAAIGPRHAMPEPEPSLALVAEYTAAERDRMAATADRAAIASEDLAREYAPAAIGRPVVAAGPAGLPVHQEVQACLPREGDKGMREVVNGRNGRINAEWDVGRCSVRVVLDRMVDFGPAENRVVSLSADGRFQIAQEGLGPDRKLTVTPGRDGAPVYGYEVAGERADMDQSARAWMAEMIPAIYRITGLDAKERAQRLLEAGGTAALVDEVRQISTDHVAGLYLGFLLQRGELSDQEVQQIFESAGARIDSDHELGQLLRTAWRPGLSGATRSAYLTAAETLESDHELGQVIKAFLADAPSTTEAVEIVTLTRNIESDHELVQVLNGVLDRAESDGALRSAVLDAARGIESDYELSQLLVRLAKGAGPEVLESDVFLELIKGLSSDYELGQMLSVVLDQPGLDADGLMEIAELSTRIESDYEQAELLSSMIEKHSPLPDAVSDRVVDAAESLDSDHERDRVISLLVRRSRSR